MSLINQMLSDLESRQAYLEEESSSALNGLYCSDTYEYREDHSRPRLLFMLLSIILITVSIYAVFRFSGMDGFNMSPAGQALSTMTPDDGVSAEEEFNSKIIPVNRQESDVIRSVSEARDTETKSAIHNSPAITTGSAAGPVTNPDKISKQLVPAKNAARATAPVTQSSGYSLPALTLADTIVIPAEKSANEQPEPAEQKITSLLVDRSDEGYVIDMQFSARPEYTLYTLENPSRMVLELRDFRPQDINIPDSLQQQSVTIRTRDDKQDTYQLIFDFQEPVSLLDTWVTDLDQGLSLQVTLVNENRNTVRNISGKTGINTGPVKKLPVENTEPEVVYDVPVLEKKVHKQDLVKVSDDLYMEGMELIRDDNLIEAIDRLYSAISMHEGNHKARIALVEILLRQGDDQAARQLLSDGLNIRPDHSQMAKLMAQLLAGEQNDGMALYYLERALPDIRQDIEYHALVAALLQRQERHKEAIVFYRNVLAINPDKGIWWMGLGISLEATGNGHQALYAYRKARQDDKISPSVASYLDDRISKLNQRQPS